MAVAIISQGGLRKGVVSIAHAYLYVTELMAVTIIY